MAELVKQEGDYTYENSEINEFFQRPQVLSAGSESPSTAGGEINFDQVSLAGGLPDIVSVGSKVRLNGINGAVELLNDDGEVVGVITGDLSNYV